MAVLEAESYEKIAEVYKSAEFLEKILGEYGPISKLHGIGGASSLFQYNPIHVRANVLLVLTGYSAVYF